MGARFLVLITAGFLFVFSNLASQVLIETTGGREYLGILLNTEANSVVIRTFDDSVRTFYKYQIKSMENTCVELTLKNGEEISVRIVAMAKDIIITENCAWEGKVPKDTIKTSDVVSIYHDIFNVGNDDATPPKDSYPFLGPTLGMPGGVNFLVGYTSGIFTTKCEFGLLPPYMAGAMISIGFSPIRTDAAELQLSFCGGYTWMEDSDVYNDKDIVEYGFFGITESLNLYGIFLEVGFITESFKFENNHLFLQLGYVWRFN